MLIMNQHACNGKINTINTSPQKEHYKNIVGDRSIKVSGGQNITTLNKHKILISIRVVSPYTPLRTCDDKEWESLPHVTLESDKF